MGLLDKDLTMTGFPEIKATEKGYVAIGEVIVTTKDEYLIKISIRVVGNGETQDEAMNSYYIIAQETIAKWNSKLEDFLCDNGLFTKGGYQLTETLNSWPYLASMLFKRLHANAANNYSGYVDENEEDKNLKELDVVSFLRESDRTIIYGKNSDDFHVIAPSDVPVKIGDTILYRDEGVNFGWFVRIKNSPGRA